MGRGRRRPRIGGVVRRRPVAVVLLLVSLGLIAYSLWSNQRNDARTTGEVVVAADDVCVVSVRYQVDGRDYQVRLPDTSGRYSCRNSPVGTQRELRYDPDRPSRATYAARSNGVWFWTGAAVLIGVYLLVRRRQDQDPA